MIISAEKLATHETCPRRMTWGSMYSTRISLVGALYRALDAGLRAEKDPEKAAENEYLALAGRPGLDVCGHDVFAVAMHYAKLAGILAVALRSGAEQWKPVEDVAIDNGHIWHSSCYETEGKMRRIVLVDRWSDDRKQQERLGWRTLGETCMLDRPLTLTSITIGSSSDKRRVSPWTRCYRHPRNGMMRFKRVSTDEDFGATWNKEWRENVNLTTKEWLDRMAKDGCMADLVNTVECPVPKRRTDYLAEMYRRTEDIARGDTPVRLGGCFDWAPCAFLPVCHGEKSPAKPEDYGFVRITQ